MAEKIIFATGNANKIREINEILGSSECEIISMKDAGIDIDIVEDGETFEDNATIKARAVFEECKKRAAADDNFKNVIVMADDSGLEVDYLDKAPGVYSSRFMGEDTDYTTKNNAIIQKLDGVEHDDRSARFVCVIAAVLPDESVLTTRGTIEGFIGHEIAGANGFGYDPIFYVEEYGCTTAELSPEEKNAISHRGKALRAMKAQLSEKGEI